MPAHRVCCGTPYNSTLDRMRYRLTIAGSFGHPYETRYQLTAESADFYGSTWVWGNESESAELAKVLRNFPSSIPSSVDFIFGGAGIGRCALRFQTVNGTGHCCVWAILEAEYPLVGAEREQASICIGFEPAALDRFSAELEGSKGGALMKPYSRAMRSNSAFTDASLLRRAWGTARRER